MNARYDDWPARQGPTVSLQNRHVSKLAQRLRRDSQTGVYQGLSCRFTECFDMLGNPRRTAGIDSPLTLIKRAGHPNARTRRSIVSPKTHKPILWALWTSFEQHHRLISVRPASWSCKVWRRAESRRKEGWGSQDKMSEDVLCHRRAAVLDVKMVELSAVACRVLALHGPQPNVLTGRKRQ